MDNEELVDDETNNYDIVGVVTKSSPMEALLATAGPVEIALETRRDAENGEPIGWVTLGSFEAQAALLALQGATYDDIGAALSAPPNEIEKFLSSPMAQALLGKIESAITAKLQRGDYGPIPMAKHAAEHMMGVLISTAKKSRNDNTKRQAAMDVLALAGHVAVKKAEVLNVNELIDSMDVQELNKFISEGVWPDRLRDRAAMLSMMNKNNSKITKSNQRAIDITPEK